MHYIDTQYITINADARTLRLRLADVTDAAGRYFEWMLNDLPYVSGMLEQYASEAKARRAIDTFIDRNAATLRRG